MNLLWLLVLCITSSRAGLIAHYSFDNVTEDVIRDESGNGLPLLLEIDDSEPSNHTKLLSQFPGKVRESFFFDGQVVGRTSLQIGLNFTISLWYRSFFSWPKTGTASDPWYQGAVLVSTDNIYQADVGAFGLSVLRNRFAVGCGNETLIAATVISNSVWHNLVARRSYNPTTKSFKCSISVDDHFTPPYTYSTDGTYVPPENTTIIIGNAAQKLVADLDEIKFFSTELSQLQILQNLDTFPDYCPNDDSPEGNITSYPRCGIVDHQICLDGQCCSQWGYCGPIRDFDGYYKGDNGPAPYREVRSLYCNPQQLGSWDLVECNVTQSVTTVYQAPPLVTTSSDGSDASDSVSESPSERRSAGEIAGITVGAVVCAGLIATAVLIFRKGLMIKSGSDLDHYEFSNSDDDFDQRPKLKLEDIDVVKKIGEGSFGTVYMGLWHGTKVAMKSLKGHEAGDNSEHYQSFKEEMAMLRTLAHPNIIQFLGVVEVNSEPLYLITEYIPGGSVLERLRKQKEHIPLTGLLKMAKGACKGMAYLQQAGIIHRDLSCRNLLVDNRSFRVKVADFGMSQVLRHGSSSEEDKSRFPVRWTAPEVLEGKASTSKSDVFSFGVTTWEILSYGALPYSDMSNAQVWKGVVKGMLRLNRPENCPAPLYKLLKRCWKLEPERRPDFIEILDVLVNVMAPLKPAKKPSISLISSKPSFSKSTPNTTTAIKSSSQDGSAPYGVETASVETGSVGSTSIGTSITEDERSSYSITGTIYVPSEENLSQTPKQPKPAPPEKIPSALYIPTPVTSSPATSAEPEQNLRDSYAFSPH